LGSMHVVKKQRSFGKFVFSSTCENDVTHSEQAKPTHENIIRLAPPLVISEEQIRDALKIMEEAITELPTLKGKTEDDVIPVSEKGVHIGLDI
jgi:acetylornithine/succinyldiaminopimelate/putrescine aminotransferase